MHWSLHHSKIERKKSRMVVCDLQEVRVVSHFNQIKMSKVDLILIAAFTSCSSTIRCGMDSIRTLGRCKWLGKRCSKIGMGSLILGRCRRMCWQRRQWWQRRWGWQKAETFWFVERENSRGFQVGLKMKVLYCKQNDDSAFELDVQTFYTPAMTQLLPTWARQKIRFWSIFSSTTR